MTLVFGFCSSDRFQAVHLAEWIRQLGNVENHDCLIIHPDDTNAEGIEESLRAAFRYVEVLSFRPKLNGWPQGPNEMHARAAFHLYSHARFRGHWLWLEADCAPMYAHWLNDIDRSYQREGKPFMGVLSEVTDHRTGATKGKHMIGVGVYPQDFPRVCPLVRNIVATTVEYVNAKRVPEAFDVYFRHYTVPQMTVTPLIQHIWRATGFILEGGRIRALEHGPGVQTDVIQPETALLHGVKDSTLLDILKERNPYATPARKIETRAEVRQTPDRREKPVEVSSVPNGSHARSEANGASKTPVAAAPIAEELLDAVMPPFPEGTPEYGRMYELLQANWNKTRAYGWRLLEDQKATVKNMLKVDLVNAIVLREREQMKEPWTAVLKAGPPVAPVREWKAGDGSKVELSDTQAKRMLALRARRQTVGAQ